MTLLDPSLSSAFLVQYKRLLGDIAAKPMKTNDDYKGARNVFYKDELNKSYVFDSSYEESLFQVINDDFRPCLSEFGIDYDSRIG